MWLINLIEDFYFIVEFLFWVLGVACFGFLLVIFYRLYRVLGRVDAALKDLSFYRPMIKDVMVEFRKFCLRHNQPQPYPDDETSDGN